MSEHDEGYTTSETFPTYEAAKSAEKVAIETEKPRFKSKADYKNFIKRNGGMGAWDQATREPTRFENVAEEDQASVADNLEKAKEAIEEAEELRRSAAEHRRHAEELHVNAAAKDETQKLVREVFAWLEAGQFQLQRADVSRMDAWMKEADIIGSTIPEEQPHSFLVKHNWAAAFAGDNDFEDKASECCFPAPVCLFEFAISGRPVLVLAKTAQTC